MAARRALALALTALLLLLGAIAAAPAAWSDALPPADGVADPTIALFHGDGCPHCAAERAFLADLVAAHPEVTVDAHEVWYDPAGRDLLLATAQRMGFEPTGVPVTIIGDQVWIGFGDRTAQEIEQAALAAVAGSPPVDASDATPAQTVAVPLLGDVDLDDTSLLAATVAIGFVDGVNPCSLWVLSLLLAMVLNRGSRGRVLLVGGVFLGVTAGMYALYMVGMYSAASYLSDMGWLRLLVAVVCAAFGALQVKDGLGVERGPSLSISPERRPALYARMRFVASPERALAATLAGAVVLAVAVSLLETPCTAGLPLLWTTMLADQQVGVLTAASLFAVYMLVFLLDELVVFAAAVLTFRGTRRQERHGRALKLLAGSVLLCLATTMLLAPTTLTTLVGTLAVFGIAAGLATALWLAATYRTSISSSGSSPRTSRTTETATPAE